MELFGLLEKADFFEKADAIKGFLSDNTRSLFRDPDLWTAEAFLKMVAKEEKKIRKKYLTKFINDIESTGVLIQDIFPLEIIEIIFTCSILEESEPSDDAVQSLYPFPENNSSRLIMSSFANYSRNKDFPDLVFTIEDKRSVGLDFKTSGKLDYTFDNRLSNEFLVIEKTRVGGKDKFSIKMDF
jgi:hypothetical protein